MKIHQRGDVIEVRRRREEAWIADVWKRGYHVFQCPRCGCRGELEQHDLERVLWLQQFLITRDYVWLDPATDGLKGADALLEWASLQAVRTGAITLSCPSCQMALQTGMSA